MEINRTFRGYYLIGRSLCFCKIVSQVPKYSYECETKIKENSIVFSVCWTQH